MIVKRTALTLLVGLSTACAANAYQQSTVAEPGAETTSAVSATSDHHLATDVRRALGHASGLNVSRVAVTAAGGKVTLSGSAPTQEQIALAQQLASRVAGVTDVTNNLVVRTSGKGS